MEISIRALRKYPFNLQLLQNAAAFAGTVGDLDRAEILARKYATLRNEDPAAHNNLGLILNKKGAVKAAKQSYEKALSLDQNNENALVNMGNIFKNERNYDKAIIFYWRALTLNPENSSALNNLGRVYTAQNKLVEAEQYYQKALELKPADAEYCWNMALLSFAKLDFRRAWQLAESRLRPERYDKQIVPPSASIPVWQGEPLQGKTILLWCEQGIGDEVMFASVLPELANTGAKVIVACDSRLVTLFNRSFEFIQAIGKRPESRYGALENSLNFHLALGSLPKFYRNSLEDFPSFQDYLKVDKALVNKWKRRFDALPPKINIGISWRGGKEADKKIERSIDLSLWRPILQQNANFINLQYGDTIAELGQIKDQLGLHIYDWEDTDPLLDLDSFAAQIKALDMVISVDNSTVHFAGALGIKTWVLLPFAADWRWSIGREDSYWYPSLMLFRQASAGDWVPVIAQAAECLSVKSCQKI